MMLQDERDLQMKEAAWSCFTDYNHMWFNVNYDPKTWSEHIEFVLRLYDAVLSKATELDWTVDVKEKALQFLKGRIITPLINIEERDNLLEHLLDAGLTVRNMAVEEHHG